MRASAWGVRALSVACVLGWSLAGCSKGDGPKEDPNVIATVNGEVVSRADFEKELARELMAMEGTGARTPEEVVPFKRALVKTAVERLLLLQAAKKLGVAVSAEEVDRRVLRLSADYPAGRFDEALVRGQLPLEDLKRKTAEQLTVEKLLQEHVYPRVAATEQELRSHFESHEAEFSAPEEVRAAQIVVKELDEARRVQAQLRAGKKFGELARKYSISPEAAAGGDLGFFARGVMPPAFDAVVFELGVGESSDVVGTDYGFHIFRVLEKRPARKRDFASARQSVEERLLKQKRIEAEAEFLASLREQSQVVVNEQSLAAVAVKLSVARSAAD